jgi:hypothetical protein
MLGGILSTSSIGLLRPLIKSPPHSVLDFHRSARQRLLKSSFCARRSARPKHRRALRPSVDHPSIRPKRAKLRDMELGCIVRCHSLSRHTRR